MLVLGVVRAQQPAPARTTTLTFNVEWKLVNAGTLKLKWQPKPGAPYGAGETQLLMESQGLVSRLYYLKDDYRSQHEDVFCTTSTSLDAREGKRHREVLATFDRANRKATYLERDLIKDQIIKEAETDTAHCAMDILGGMMRLRSTELRPGQSLELPMSDGKKSAMVRVEAQEKETVKTRLGTFNTVRYEIFVLNGVLYGRKGRVHIWLTDDARRLPVQVSARFSLLIGTITAQLIKEETS